MRLALLIYGQPTLKVEDDEIDIGRPQLWRRRPRVEVDELRAAEQQDMFAPTLEKGGGTGLSQGERRAWIVGEQGGSCAGGGISHRRCCARNVSPRSTESPSAGLSRCVKGGTESVLEERWASASLTKSSRPCPCLTHLVRSMLSTRKHCSSVCAACTVRISLAVSAHRSFLTLLVPGLSIVVTRKKEAGGQEQGKVGMRRGKRVMDARGCWASADGGDGFGTRGCGEERVREGRGTAGKAEGPQVCMCVCIKGEKSTGGLLGP